MDDVRRDADQFAQDGFCVVRDALVPAELEALRAETLAQIEAGPHREPSTDFRTKALPDGREVFFRIQFLTAKAIRNDSMLLALGQPEILKRVAAILGDDWTTYGSAMVFKAQGGGPEVDLHRDTRLDARVFDPGHVFFNADIYLDRATPETGCLKVLPGSHRIEDARPLVAQGLDNLPGLVDVPMEPGDVLFHDAMLLHGSLPTAAESPLRRVLYYSYQSAAWMQREGVIPGFPVGRRWLAQHIKLVAHAIECRRGAAHLSGERQVDYQVPSEWAGDVERVPLDLRPVEGNLPWEVVEGNSSGLGRVAQV